MPPDVRLRLSIDGVGVERRAVGERDALADLDRPHRGVLVGLDALGEEAAAPRGSSSVANSGSKNVRMRIWQYESHCTVCRRPRRCRPRPRRRRRGARRRPGPSPAPAASPGDAPSPSSVGRSVVSVPRRCPRWWSPCRRPPTPCRPVPWSRRGASVSSVAVVSSAPPTASSSFLSEQAAATSAKPIAAAAIRRPRRRLSGCVGRTSRSPLQWICRRPRRRTLRHRVVTSVTERGRHYPRRPRDWSSALPNSRDRMTPRRVGSFDALYSSRPWAC